MQIRRLNSWLAISWTLPALFGQLALAADPFPVAEEIIRADSLSFSPTVQAEVYTLSIQCADQQLESHTFFHGETMEWMAPHDADRKTQASCRYELRANTDLQAKDLAPFDLAPEERDRYLDDGGISLVQRGSFLLVNGEISPATPDNLRWDRK